MATRIPIPGALWVYGPDGLVGTLHNTDPLSFSYSAAWLSTAGAVPIHPDLPLVAEASSAPQVAAFFENLLPEGDQRTVISMREHVTTVFGLLARVGGESAGAYTLVAEGEAPQSPIYQPLSWEMNSSRNFGVQPYAKADMRTPWKRWSRAERRPVGWG